MARGPYAAQASRARGAQSRPRAVARFAHEAMRGKRRCRPVAVAFQRARTRRRRPGSLGRGPSIRLDYSGSRTHASPLFCARFAGAARSARTLAMLLPTQLGSACVTSAPRASSEGLAPCPRGISDLCFEATSRHVQTESRRPSEAVVTCALRARQSKAPRPGIAPRVFRETGPTWPTALLSARAPVRDWLAANPRSFA